MPKAYYTSANVVGDRIHLRFIDGKGRDHTHTVENYQPTLFTKTNETTPYQDIYGHYCVPKHFDGIKEMRKWYREQKDIGLEVLGMEDPLLQFLSDKFGHDMKMKFDQAKIYIVDIEVKADEMPKPMNPVWPIDQIGLYDKLNDRYYSFSLYSWSPENCHERVKDIAHKITHIQYSSEQELLQAFIKFWQASPPHILSGWNSNLFDQSYTFARIEHLFSETSVNRFSPFGRVMKRTTTDDYGEEQLKYVIDGVEHLDYMELYKKFVLEPRPNYKLDTIGEIETKQKKLQYDGKLKDLSEKDPQLYVDYNLIDVRLVDQIDQKRNLIDLATFVAYHAKVPIPTIFSPVRTWDATIFNALRKEHKVVPMSRMGEDHNFEGGYVKEPQKKLNGWVMSFDFTSLYPHVIMQCNISPETLVDYKPTAVDREWIEKTAKPYYGDEYACAPNGAYYRKDIRGVVASEIEKVFLDRKASKKKAGKLKEEAKRTGSKEIATEAGTFSTREKALKVMINALYGALGNIAFRYYDWRNAEAVTAFGRVAIQWGERKINEWLNGLLGKDKDYVLAIDTDSLYIDFQPLIDAKGLTLFSKDEIADWLDSLAEKVLVKKNTEWFEELADYMNSYGQYMHFDRENISPASFWKKKKHYAMLIKDSEGDRFADDELELKHMGLETKRSSTPVYVREGLKQALWDILQNGEDSLQENVENFHDEYMKTDIQNISEVSSANNMKQYSDQQGHPKKRCPGHLKGALLHNRISKKYGLDKIPEGDKIEFVALKQPNMFDNKDATAIAWSAGDLIPLSIRDYVYEYVDRETMINKHYYKPLSAWCDIVGMKYEDRGDLFEAFG